MNKYLTTHEAADIIGVSDQTLRNWDKSGVLKPDIIYPSGYRRYSKEKINLFIEKVKKDGRESENNLL